MAEYKEILKAGDLKDGEVRELDIEGRQLFVAKVNGKLYAASRLCPHMGANLAQGKLEGTVITCPRHGSQFDLKDGHVVRWTDWTGFKLAIVKMLKSPRSLTVYPVKVDGDKVLVQV